MPRPTPRSFPPRRWNPPDYSRRSVRWKLFALVAALIAVLAAAEHARNPQAWQWMWRLNEIGAEREEPFNNRLPPRERLASDELEGTFIAAEENPTAGDAEADVGDATSPADPAGDPPVDFDPVARTWEQAWRDVFERLEPSERSLLFEMLHGAAHHQALDPDKTPAGAALIDRAQALWDDYQTVAFQAVAELRGDDRMLWVDVLRRVNGQFATDLRPALQAVVDGRTPTGAEERTLRDFQATLETLTLARIEDDTVFRPAEREILFHLLGELRETPPDELLRRSQGTVAYLQLFKQPADYRGQIVTVEGTVKLAYRVDALPDNYLGIDEFYVYWVHPSGGPNAPIVVYALEAPPGFPPMKHKDRDRATTKLQEDVTVTGVFFKRWAYAGQDGTYTAPLVLAAAPTWHPAPPVADARPALGPGEYAAIVIAALLLAVCATAALWHRTRRPRTTDDAYGPASANLAALRDVPLAPSPEEALRNLERDAQP